MQWADVYACMWGGDSIHALHLRRGAIVIEMINQQFLKHGPWDWVCPSTTERPHPHPSTRVA